MSPFQPETNSKNNNKSNYCERSKKRLRMSRRINCCLISLVQTMIVPTTLLFVLLFPQHTSSKPIHSIESSSKFRSSLDIGRSVGIEARLHDTISEVEWLLHQLVNILNDMVDGIDHDRSLLQNNNFRLILIGVVKRIDYILEHFENVGTSLLTPSVHHELGRIDCIRIRLINYLSQSRRFDDSKCSPINANKKPEHHQPPTTTEQILPLLTQIVSLLAQVSNQLHVIEKEIHHGSHVSHHPSGATSPQPIDISDMAWTKRPSIDWDRLISQMSSSRPMNSQQATTNMPPPSTISENEWNNILSQGSNQPSMTTENWQDLISQVMEGMSMTTATTSMPSNSNNNNNANTNGSSDWEDLMNQLINQWNTNRNQ